MAQDNPSTNEAEEPENPARKRPWQSWESLIEEQIKDAERRGEFTNLRGRGKPLNVGDDSNDPAAMANRALRGAGFVPPAIDMGREIDEARIAAAQALDRIRRRRAFLLQGGQPPEDDRARFNAARAKAIADHRARLKAINDRVLALTLSAPSALHRRTIPVEREIQAFEEECPPL